MNNLFTRQGVLATVLCLFLVGCQTAAQELSAPAPIVNEETASSAESCKMVFCLADPSGVGEATTVQVQIACGGKIAPNKGTLHVPWCPYYNRHLDEVNEDFRERGCAGGPFKLGQCVPVYECWSVPESTPPCSPSSSLP